uniref:Midasin n=1 Tax=Amphiprion ocellaris TaxID=80972 RepID=A0AAQ6AJN3_AMPOC
DTMENLELSLSSLGIISRHVDKSHNELSQYLSKQIWSQQDRQCILEGLAQLLLEKDYTLLIARHLRPLILDLLERNAERVKAGGRISHDLHERLCVALSKLLGISPDAQAFAARYFNDAPPVFQRLFFTSEESSAVQYGPKRMKLRDLMGATLRFLQSDCAKFRMLWDWSPCVSQLLTSDVMVRGYTAHCLALVSHMTDNQKTIFLRKVLTSDEILALEETQQLEVEKALVLANQGSVMWRQEKANKFTRGQVVSEDLSSNVVAVCGVILPRTAPRQPQQVNPKDLVLVDSTCRNLRRLALAVASQKPVLLEGPIGCGKTALVEFMAAVTGHIKATEILKVQLGDQTDSKMLLGMYRCTDIPGKFVWQPGTLTQAVSKGQWILLEDIDHAPLDVISVLLPLMENKKLMIPGREDCIDVAPGFQFFATRRMYYSGGSWHKPQNSHAALLDKYWTKLQMGNMTREELKKVLISRYPNLTVVSDRLLDIYCQLTGERHSDVDTSSLQTPDDSQQHKSEDRSTPLEGRALSLRDLLKWCERISVNFDSSSSATAQHVFQEALDCFTAMLSCPESRQRMAEIIGSKLNISREKAQHFCQMYQPGIMLTELEASVGRVTLARKQTEAVQENQTFAATRPSAVLLEQLAVCVAKGEPVLLVGETGTGKTSTVQHLARVTGHRLRVVNMNQQSDTADLLGGYKPVDHKQILLPLREAFEDLFSQTYSRKQNLTFLGHVQTCFRGKRWQDLLKLMDHVCKSAVAKELQEKSNAALLQEQWEALALKLNQTQQQIRACETAMVFAFVEGTLAQAVKKGHWILLDEINLAAAETLECLSGLLEGSAGSLVLLDRGDTEPLVRHPDFRLFACMNPATDVGKRNLPLGLRNRFTELYVEELENEGDLRILVLDYLKCLNPHRNVISGIISFYLAVRKEANSHLVDGTGHRPHYSLRTLCRALKYVATNPCYNVQRSLYEGFCLSFLTQLDRSSHPLVQKLVCQHILMGNTKCLKQPIPAPSGQPCVEMEGYWVSQGELEAALDPSYILTASDNFYPGETSVGKTSLIRWLAAATGNQCVRINNHEHTDIQEYIGCYSSDDRGKLIFKEGVLIDAMRKGYWIILDELNLAPTDVLEALNRLLDDNRELFVAETQEVIKAHPRFMLFATQNPPGLYGGRKVLSRAFRNRFVELHFDELPSGELETILHQRCSLPPSYCTKLVKVMQDLQSLRRGSSVFAGKHGFITLRDLFRWADRYRLEQQTEASQDWLQHLADDGYMLLAGRVRKPEEEATILSILEKHFKRTVNPENLFSQKQELSKQLKEFRHIVWTHGMRRLAVLVGRALRFGESVLLVGDTGCGKTTICQLFAALAAQKFFTVNCHLHMETSDFLGGLRPSVRKEKIYTDSRLFQWHDGPLVLAMKEGGVFLMDEISLADDSVLERLNSVLETEKSLVLAEKGSGDNDDVELIRAATGFRLVATMNPGGDFGKKELSPALRNRFTEIWCPQSNSRSDLVQIIQHNLRSGLSLDGGDVAELMLDFIEWLIQQDFGRRCILSVRDILSWVNFLNAVCERDEDGFMTMGALEDEEEAEWDIRLDTVTAFIHAACLVYIDGIGSGTTVSSADSALLARRLCLGFLQQRLSKMTKLDQEMLDALRVYDSSLPREPQWGEDFFGIDPFYIALGPQTDSRNLSEYAIAAGTTAVNAQRLLRALKLQRPVLLEGSPGVGKTSLVAALAKASGNHLVRINLSEQTDVTDLFGTDLPVEGGKGGEFAWRDGPLLAALKAGHWVVLDELNLASQSVLEGLNACFDHRAEIYIPELGMSFQVQHEKTKIFGCQNPFTQGGGRKGLPKSFLNRFTQVFVDQLTSKDMEFIGDSIFPSIDKEIVAKMVEFSNKEVCVERRWGQKGSPWEFNLRDMFRWCQLMQTDQSPGFFNPGQHVSLVYADRMRTEADKAQVLSVFRKVFGEDFEPYCGSREFHITPLNLQVGFSVLHRSGGAPVALDPPLSLTHQSLRPLESLMKCVEMGWMTILVGPTASGKTSLVRLLALLTGHRLRVMAMNSAMDTTELLGGFEQVDIMRPWQQVLESVDYIVAMVIRRGLMSLDVGIQDTEFLLQTWGLFCHWLKEEGLQRTGGSVNSEALNKLEVIILLLQKLNTKLKVFTDMSKLQMDFTLLKERLAQLEDGWTNGGFEWLDGMLVQALQAGDWLLMDNVNFCSASVLDRLNALLEPGGVLTINERGVIDGKTPKITPHPNFRLFLTMDPVHGELSRAMRNRGVEVYIPGEHEGVCWDTLDLKTLLHTAGVTGDCVCDLLIEIHKGIKSAIWDSPASSVASLLNAATLLSCQLQRGVDLPSALQHACGEAYSFCQRTTASQKQAQQVIEQHLAILDTEDWGSGLLCAGVWPDGFPSALLSTEDSCFSAVLRDGQVLTFCLNTLSLQGKRNRPLSLNDLQRALQSSGVHEGLVFSGGVVDLEEGDALRLIPTAVRLLTERASHGDWILRSSWLSHLGKSYKFVPGLLVEVFELQTLFTQKQDIRFISITFFFISSYISIYLILPDEYRILVDMRWNKQYLDILANKCNFEDEERYMEFLEILQLLQWLDRFWDVCSTLPADSQGISVLSLHWQWVQKHLILRLPQLLLGDADATFEYTPLTKLRLSLTTHLRFNNIYLPHQLESVAECASRLRLLSKALDVSDMKLDGTTGPWRQKLVQLQGAGLGLDIKESLLEAWGLVLLANNQLDPKNVEQQQCSMTSRGLLDVCSMSEGDEPADGLPLATEVLQQLGRRAQLWPLMEELAVLNQLRLSTDLLHLAEDCLRRELSRHLRYCLQSTPMNVSQLQPLWFLLSSDRVSRTVCCYSENLSYEILWQVRLYSSSTIWSSSQSVTSEPDRWLKWDPLSPDNEPSPKLHHGGPALLSKAVWSHCMLGVLSNSDAGGRWEPSGVALLSLSHVSLGEWKERIQQLQDVSAVLWDNMAIPALAEFRGTDFRLQGAVLRRQLQSMADLLPPSLQEGYMESCESLVEDPDPLIAAQEIQTVFRDFLPPNLLPDGLVEACITCLQQYVQSKVQGSNPLARSGVFWVNMGLLQIKVWTPQTIFDPAVKRAYKLNYAQQEMALLQEEWRGRSLSSQLMTGAELEESSTTDGFQHPRIRSESDAEHSEQIAELSRKQACRPHEPQYGRLFQELQHYRCSIGQTSAVEDLLSHLLKVLHGSSSSKSRSSVQALLKEEAVWQNSQQRFCQRLLEDYPLYPDVVGPVRTGILQLRHGMRLVASQVAASLTPVPGLPKLVSCLLAFPSLSPSLPSYLARADFLCSRTCMDVVRSLVKLLPQQDTEHVVPQSSTLLLNALLYVQCHTLSTGEFSQEAHSLFRHICKALVNEWDEQERRKREREQMEASLYRSRSQLHGSGLTEDEQEERDFRRQFPQFNKDFADITSQPTLEGPADTEPEGEEDKPQEESEMGSLSPAAMNTVVQVHQSLCLGYAQSLWYQSTAPANRSKEHIKALVSSYQIASPVMSHSELDQQLTGSELLLSALLQNTVQGSGGADGLAVTSEGPYDFYQQPNMSEARLCLPVLEQLMVAVKQRLEDWPDHPALVQLIVVMERIMAFNLACPLAKFLNGLEILLSKAQDWENNASRTVSLRNELEPVTQLIIQWRKLELNCWSSSLDNAMKRHTEKSTKHWFSVYQLVERYLEEQRNLERLTLSSVSSTLQAFMEGSTLGEFNTRLAMLLSFHCHLLLVPNQPGQENLSNLLWNLHKYYNQFSECIQTKITQLRQPIEKELKDFVKISKWNDVSFWSIKQSVEKTHRTLFKFVKKFEEALSGPSVPSLVEQGNSASLDGVDTNPEETPIHRVHQALKTLLLLISFFLWCFVTELCCVFQNEGPEEETEAASLQGRLPVLSRKMKKMCIQLLKKNPVPELAEDLDYFTGEVISNLRDLQSLSVDTSADKEKQKAEVKHILQQKQRALSDLFKMLAEMGLSYRKGLTWNRTADPEKTLCMQPLEMNTALSAVRNQEQGEKLLTSWDGCQKYFYRSWTRRTALQTALQHAAKELGLGNIERCRGFSSHLFKLLLRQRRRLTKLTEQWIHLRRLTNSVQGIKAHFQSNSEDPGCTVPPQASLRDWVSNGRVLATQCTTLLQQLAWLLQCCPEDPQQKEEASNCKQHTLRCPSPLAAQRQPPGCLMRRGDTSWSQLHQRVTAMLKETQNLKVELDSVAQQASETVLHTWNHFNTCCSAFDQLGAVVAQMPGMEQLFTPALCVGNADSQPAITQSLQYVRGQVEANITEFTTWKTQLLSLGQQHTGDFTDQPYQYLIFLQILVEREQQKEQQGDTKKEDQDEEPAEDVLKPGHLTRLLEEEVEAEVEALNVRDVSSGLERLLSRLRTHRDACQACRMLVRLEPLMGIYSDLVRYYVAVSLGAHRSTGKLLSVLASIFTELAQKGFCLPQELMAGGDGEGATEFHDYEGGGIGEGEGNKDVSDKIENEDQVEDTFQEGQEKEEQQEKGNIKSEDNAIEMSEDFDGQMHDGDENEPGEDEDSDEENEEELDKKMGDLGEGQTDTLDERLWGDDEDDNEDEGSDKEEESGQGMDQVHNITTRDQCLIYALAVSQREFDENEVDPYHGQQDKRPEPEAMDLPEDLNLDKDDEAGDDGEGEEENPFDIDDKPMDVDEKEDGQKDGGDEEQGAEEMEENQPGEENNQDPKTEEGGEEEEGGEKAEEDQESAEKDEAKEEEEEEKGQEAGRNEDMTVPSDKGQKPKEEEEEDGGEDEEQPESAERKEHQADGQTGEQNVQSDTAVEVAGEASERDQAKEEHGSGSADASQSEGHESKLTARMSSQKQTQSKTQSFKRKPGQADNERSTGDYNERVNKRLRTVESSKDRTEDNRQSDAQQESDLYEHIKQGETSYDTQTYDVASADQQKAAGPQQDQDEDQNDEDVAMETENQEEELQAAEVQELKPEQLDSSKASQKGAVEEEEKWKDRQQLREEDKAERSTESTIHTVAELLLETMQVNTKHLLLHFHGLMKVESAAASMWHQYQTLTSALSQQLCEQLRLILEPTQAAKLKGDYRTGKRLNMRKVIPYIASQFRKDKIWLRRTKPSKREYQICLAVDDSSSMVDNHSKQLAFESLSVIINALTLLEVGQVSVCSFGEEVQLLHPFQQQFNDESGARILRLCQFQQKKTRIAQFLETSIKMFLAARQQNPGSMNSETAQLLVIVSDGRGLFLEGKERVMAAVRAARSANVFVIFVVLDNPNSRDSILDIKVPIFKGPGEMPEIRSYMDEFPFPFYVILRDVNALPETLSDALRQWFELVTAFHL